MFPFHCLQIITSPNITSFKTFSFRNGKVEIHVNYANLISDFCQFCSLALCAGQQNDKKCRCLAFCSIKHKISKQYCEIKQISMRTHSLYHLLQVLNATYIFSLLNLSVVNVFCMICCLATGWTILTNQNWQRS